MRFVTLAALVLATMSVGTSSFALMPLPKEELDAIRREWRAAPLHGQAEVVKTRHPPELDASRCGEITAVMRRRFKGGDSLPPGSSVTFDHCIFSLDLAFTDFDREFPPGRKLEVVLAYDPTVNGKAAIVRGGLMQIRGFSRTPQLNPGE